MKKKNSLLTKRLYFAIAVLTLLIAAGIMTSAFSLPPQPGSPTHDTLYTRTIVSMNGMNDRVVVDSAILSNNNITANGGGSAYAVKGSNAGAEGYLGYNGYGVYTPGALYAGSIQTSSFSTTGDLSAKSFSATGANPNGYGVYSPSYPIYGSYYTGGTFYGSAISTSGSIYSGSTIYSSSTIRAMGGYLASGGQPGINVCFNAIVEGVSKKVCTVSGLIISVA